VTARGGADALDLATKRALASAFQSAAVKQLEDKVALALGWCRKRGLGVQHLVVSGGVASNMFLRDRYRFIYLQCARCIQTLMFLDFERRW
jgi:N6-L-threonylcarbamoyladenine synthase